jgi:hypothetical protein
VGAPDATPSPVDSAQLLRNRSFSRGKRTRGSFARAKFHPPPFEFARDAAGLVVDDGELVLERDDVGLGVGDLLFRL